MPALVLGMTLGLTGHVTWRQTGERGGPSEKALGHVGRRSSLCTDLLQGLCGTVVLPCSGRAGLASGLPASTQRALHGPLLAGHTTQACRGCVFWAVSLLMGYWPVVGTCTCRRSRACRPLVNGYRHE